MSSQYLTCPSTHHSDTHQSMHSPDSELEILSSSFESSGACCMRKTCVCVRARARSVCVGRCVSGQQDDRKCRASEHCCEILSIASSRQGTPGRSTHIHAPSLRVTEKGQAGIAKACVASVRGAGSKFTSGPKRPDARRRCEPVYLRGRGCAGRRLGTPARQCRTASQDVMLCRAQRSPAKVSKRAR